MTPAAQSHQTSPHVVTIQPGVTVISHTRQHSASGRPAPAASMRPAVTAAPSRQKSLLSLFGLPLLEGSERGKSPSVAVPGAHPCFSFRKLFGRQPPLGDVFQRHLPARHIAAGHGNGQPRVRGDEVLLYAVPVSV